MSRRTPMPPHGALARLVAGVALCLTGAAGVQASDDAPAVQATVREIAIRAEQFVFTPSEIEVTEGETIRLAVEAVDVVPPQGSWTVV